MSSFTTKLIVTPYDDGIHWTVEDPFVYEVGLLGSGRKVIVPAGFVTDFGSIPQVFWNILPPWGTYGKPCVVHDYLYNNGFITTFGAPGIETHTDVTRAQADGILLEGMTALGVNRLTRWTIYTGVRVGGWKPWAEEHHPA